MISSGHPKAKGEDGRLLKSGWSELVSVEQDFSEL